MTSHAAPPRSLAEGFGQEQFLDVVDRDEAERRFHRHLNLSPLGVEAVPLGGLTGRVLAGDVISVRRSRLRSSER
jgi:putative molybdopterin biosynthesis protein